VSSFLAMSLPLVRLLSSASLKSSLVPRANLSQNVANFAAANKMTTETKMGKQTQKVIEKIICSRIL
jgi:hypothetical protein